MKKCWNIAENLKNLKWFKNESVNISYIKDFLGHSSLDSTALYAHADDEGGELGVRVQTSNVSDPTFEEAATNIMIDKALETGENGTERDHLLERFSRRWS